MSHYVRGLAEVGARVWGVGDSHPQALPDNARQALAGYLQVPRIMDEQDVLARVREWMKGRNIDRIEAQWEPLVLEAARLREAFGIPGMSYDTVLGFRDKQLMKERIKAAGLRVPHSARVRSPAEARAAAERFGYPLIVKPIAGAGSADTYRVDSDADLDRVMQLTRHVPEVSVEEFVEGEEFTYDTVCIDGRPVYENVAQYLPRPLDARTHEWISPIICTVRDLDQPKIRKGIELGHGVLKALNMGTGFTHMEWYLKANGEVVFGEIGCRPGGAHLVDQMNYTSDIDLFREWARAVCWKSFEADATRRYNTAIVFKRAIGEGRIRAIDGLGSFKDQYGRYLVWDNLLRPGNNRRNWKQTLVSDGFVIVRHPRWDDALTIARAAATDIRMYAS
ncbi:MAG: ATP-grasp domain-containing protein [Alphaproteobacteria bacterium]|nr:ATP-grasp domain-containing protein [Alphaproteobacteria bacterium]MCB9699720.1 ATP-grasp domain-containing protein [Alphaproteobacteria bacterium]